MYETQSIVGDFWYDGALKDNFYRPRSYGKEVNAEIIFHINIKELSFNSCELMLETPEILDIFVNSSKIDKVITGYCHDVCFKTINIYKDLTVGENEIRLACKFSQSKAVYAMLDDIKYFESVKNRLTYCGSYW